VGSIGVIHIDGVGLIPMNWIRSEQVKSSVKPPLSVAESKTTVKNVALSE
jgi:hypothetical protein